MKKVIKPSPVELLIFGVVTAVITFIIVSDTTTGGKPEINDYLYCAGSVICFIFFLLRYIFRGRIYFDEDTFTVRGKTYRFVDITRAVLGRERSRILLDIISKGWGRFSVQCITIYVKGQRVTSFTKDEPGSKEFIDLMKKHRIKFTVHNSLSSWEGEIE